MTHHIIQLIHNFHDKCEDALTTEDYDSAKIWLEAADDTVEALGRGLDDECDCELEGVDIGDGGRAWVNLDEVATPIGCVNIDNERFFIGEGRVFAHSSCEPSLEADMAIDADGLPFDLNERCHNPNCPCCVPPVYEVGCDCGKGDDVTTMSLIEVGSTLWQSGKDERRVIIKDDRGVIVASGELRVHDAEAFDGIRAK